MSRAAVPKGACVFCGRVLTRDGLVRHLRSCPQRAEAGRKADLGSGRAQRLFHLRVQDAGSGHYWLHLELAASASLGDLDEYLRAIWLECCGHLSAFYEGRAWTSAEVGMHRRVAAVLRPGTELLHIYDFGTSSYSKVKVVDWRRGRPLSSHPIFLMARNVAPTHSCAECGEQAVWLCRDCMYESNDEPTLCEAHAATHQHQEVLAPLVNSPRVGMCGYYGPAEPPY